MRTRGPPGSQSGSGRTCTERPSLLGRCGWSPATRSYVWMAVDPQSRRPSPCRPASRRVASPPIRRRTSCGSPTAAARFSRTGSEARRRSEIDISAKLDSDDQHSQDDVEDFVTQSVVCITNHLDDYSKL